MGYRIELEEIENSLNGLNYINQSAVIYSRTKENYGKIIAFVTTNDEKDEKEILKELRDHLPPYMIPNILITKNNLQKNANGKVDRKQLKNDWMAKYLSIKSRKGA